MPLVMSDRWTNNQPEEDEQSGNKPLMYNILLFCT